MYTKKEPLDNNIIIERASHSAVAQVQQDDSDHSAAEIGTLRNIV